ncbi:MAG: DUF1963 domain-containing protein [Bacilli bacterium]|nr:DUF1963 domain-containing protein [Bacilli bacterium]
MSKAIGLRFVPYDETKHIKCHFFGNPVLPKDINPNFDDSVMFLGMIDLKEIGYLHDGDMLPLDGYLYFFLDTSGSCYKLKPILLYSKNEPTVVIDDFNLGLDEGQYKGISIPRGIEFYEVEENADCCKLLGTPYDWNYEEEPKPLLLSLNHFDEGLNFLSFIDGYTYIFFGEKGKELSEATLFGEY